MNIEQRMYSIVDGIQELRISCYPTYTLPIEYLTIFSQSEKDFNSLQESLLKIGKETEANNGFKYGLEEPFTYKEEKISTIRIRKPDVHRKELGCADLRYKEEEYKDLRQIALDKGLDIILRKGYEMIELADFNINVYAYLVKDI
jgi:hypothetical protein